MSYEIHAGTKNWHFTWNYNEKIILPVLSEGLMQFNGKPCLEAAEGIASIIERLNADLRHLHTKSTLKNGINGDGMPDFLEKYGNGSCGHVTEGILRLAEVMIECYRHPNDVFIIH